MTAADVLVSGIASGGDGVGRLPDGRAVFIPRTAPGERVRVELGTLVRHQRFARGPAAEILAPAPVRVAAPCPHYGRDHCGGCQLQHLSYEAQLVAKRAIIGDCLRRIGKLEVPDPEIVPARQPWRYRSKISLAVRAGQRRTVIGLHPYDRPAAVFALTDCHITDVRLMTLWSELRGHLALFPARMTRLTLRLDREGRRHVVVESSGEPWRSADRLRGALTDPHAVVCWWHPTDGAPRVVAGPATGFPATAFEQVNPEMGSAARRWAVERAGEIRNALVWDLYGGIGDTARLLAERGATVISVDADEQAIDWARRRPDLASHGGRVRLLAGRAEDVIATLPAPSAVILNPPRAGLHRDVTSRLTRVPVAHLIYLSCDPATLARDLHRLGRAYEIRAIRGFDLFPQTAHVETVVHLVGT